MKGLITIVMVAVAMLFSVSGAQAGWSQYYDFTTAKLFAQADDTDGNVFVQISLDTSFVITHTTTELLRDWKDSERWNLYMSVQGFKVYGKVANQSNGTSIDFGGWDIDSYSFNTTRDKGYEFDNNVWSFISIRNAKIESTQLNLNEWIDEYSYLGPVTAFQASINVLGFGGGNWSAMPKGFATEIVNPVPEPATLALLGFGALCFISRRRKLH